MASLRKSQLNKIRMTSLRQLCQNLSLSYEQVGRVFQTMTNVPVAPTSNTSLMLELSKAEQASGHSSGKASTAGTSRVISGKKNEGSQHARMVQEGGKVEKEAQARAGGSQEHRLSRSDDEKTGRL